MKEGKQKEDTLDLRGTQLTLGEETFRTQLVEEPGS
jgi:hypothetical protein